MLSDIMVENTLTTKKNISGETVKKTISRAELGYIRYVYIYIYIYIRIWGLPGSTY